MVLDQTILYQFNPFQVLLTCWLQMIYILYIYIMVQFDTDVDDGTEVLVLVVIVQ